MRRRDLLLGLGSLAAVVIANYLRLKASQKPEGRILRLRREGPVPARGDRHFEHGDVVEEASWESFPASDSPAW